MNSKLNIYYPTIISLGWQCTLTKLNLCVNYMLAFYDTGNTTFVLTKVLCTIETHSVYKNKQD